MSLLAPNHPLWNGSRCRSRPRAVPEAACVEWSLRGGRPAWTARVGDARRGRAVGVDKADVELPECLGDARAGVIGAEIRAEVDDQVREVADGLACVGGQHRAPGVTRRAEARPAVTVVVPVRAHAELRLARADCDAVAVPVVLQRLDRAAAGVDALRPADHRHGGVDAPARGGRRVDAYQRPVVARLALTRG